MFGIVQIYVEPDDPSVPSLVRFDTIDDPETYQWFINAIINPLSGSVPGDQCRLLTFWGIEQENN